MVASSWCAAFSRRVDGRITTWNSRAESLFGVAADYVVGRRCFEVIRGRDVHGNEYCCPECSSWRMAARDRPVQPYQLKISIDHTREIDLRVSVFRFWRPGGPELVHLLEPLVSTTGRRDLPDSLGLTPGDRDCSPPILTRRELQVLHCLASGNGTDTIASRLQVSRTTVRNHIASCLKKLEVHSRVEAVGVAHRLHLV